MKTLNRRAALAAAASLSATAFDSRKLRAADQDAGAKASGKLGPLCVFAKPLQWLTNSELADFLEAGKWDGIEATIRKGGQVDPKNIEEELPRLVDALDAKNKKVVLFASDVNSTSDPLTQRTLEAASKAGIRYYRMSYYRYDISKPILPQIDAFARELESLVKMNRELGMTALYQNHAGAKYFGAGLWDLYRVASQQPKEQLAVAFDIRHATVESGMSWPIHWQMLKPYVGALYFKDFVWEGDKVRNVPLGEGLVKKDFYREIVKNPIEGIPVSIHMEYVDHKKPELIGESKRCVDNDRKATRKLLGL